MANENNEEVIIPSEEEKNDEEMTEEEQEADNDHNGDDGSDAEGDEGDDDGEGEEGKNGKSDNKARKETDEEKLARLERQTARQKKKMGITENKKPISVSKKPQNLSTRDTLAILKAGVHEDDLDEVLDFAAYKKISVAEALKSSTVRTLLSEKTEHRNTAAATSTGTQRRSSGKASDEKLLSDAQKGIMPESDEDMQRLVKLKMGIKK